MTIYLAVSVLALVGATVRHQDVRFAGVLSATCHPFGLSPGTAAVVSGNDRLQQHVHGDQRKHPQNTLVVPEQQRRGSNWIYHCDAQYRQRRPRAIAVVLLLTTSQHIDTCGVANVTVARSVSGSAILTHTAFSLPSSMFHSTKVSLSPSVPGPPVLLR